MTKQVKQAKKTVSAQSAQSVEDLRLHVQKHHDKSVAALAALLADPSADKRAIDSASNRVKRTERALTLAQDDSIAETLARYNMSADIWAGSAIYMLDKLHANVIAITRKIALSYVRGCTAGKGGSHSTRRTQHLVTALTEAGKPLSIKEAIYEMGKQDPTASGGTLSSQESSSRLALQALGLIEWDGITRSYTLNAAFDDVREYLSK